MKPKTIVVSLPVTDLDRTLRFYRDGLGLEPADVDESGIAFELPNLSLFLIESAEYAKYSGRAGMPGAGVPVAGACILSCAIDSRAELDDTVARAASAGGTTSAPEEDADGSYMGYVTDPDGHLWELVHNARTEAGEPAG